MVKKIFLILLVIICLHLFLLSKLKLFPYPELFIYPYLTKAGLTPYRQILDQHFPGMMFLPINLATVGIDTVSKMRFFYFIVVGITDLLLFAAARKVFKKDILAVFVLILYIIWQPVLEGYVIWIDSFVPALLLLSFYLTNSKKPKLQVFLGIVLGLGLLLKQAMFPLIAVVCFFFIIKHSTVKVLSRVAFGICLPVSMLIIWLYISGIWKDFYFWTYIFNVTTFAKMGRSYPTIRDIVVISPTIVLALLAAITNSYQKRRNSINVLLVIFFLCSLAFVFARFDFVHLQPALPFAVLLIVSLGQRASAKPKLLYSGLVLYIVVTLAFVGKFYKHNLGGEPYFFGSDEFKVVAEVRQFVNPGDTVFALGGMPHIYQLTGTLPPGKVFVFQFPWFIKVAGERILSGLVSDPPKVVVSQINSSVDGVLLRDFMPDVYAYIDRYYKVEETIGRYEIMVPNKAID